MKRNIYFSKKRFPQIAITFILIFIAYSCAVTNTMVQADVGSKHSETEYGWGGTVLLGTELPIANTSIYGLASYHKYSFTGGHDNLIQIGVQARKALGENKNWWLGGELAHVRDKSIYDEASFDNPKSNGYSVGILAGHKLPIPLLNASAFTGLNFIHFGDFKTGNLVIDPSGNSVQVKVGVEIDIPFF